MVKENPGEPEGEKRGSGNEIEFSRYIRQIILNEIGLNGQMKLKASSVLVVGCGGLGAPVLQYLVAAGIGSIGLSDSDAVEESNLNRQILFGEKDIGRKKTEIALNRLEDLNSSLNIRKHPEITDENITDICIEYDLILDCADSRSLRYLLSDFCAVNQRPFICGSSLRWDGSVYVLTDICFRCVYPVVSQRPLATCASAGLIGGMCGVVGSLMAIEAIKLILGISRSSSVLHISALDNEYIWVPLRKKHCNLCKSKSKGVGVGEGEGLKCKSENCMSSKHDNVIPHETILHDITLHDTTTHSNPAHKTTHNTHSNPAHSNPTHNTTHSNPRSIRWNEILGAEDKYLLVDIRSSTEHNMLIHPGALKCPLDVFLNNPKKAISVAEKTARGRKIALVCRNGSSSAKFAALFGALTVTGGMQEYTGLL